MNDMNRIKVVLVEKKRTAKWLAQELGKACGSFRQKPCNHF
jgi:hypothetical protein